MRIAVYGGSFNPPHVVHGLVARWLLWTGRADRVWLVPVFVHAFEGRQDKRLAPFDERLAWTRALAADVGPDVEVCAIERELPPPSYTIDTLRALRDRHPEHVFRLVVGADVLDQRHHWRDWEGIAREFDPIVVGRQGWPLPSESAIAFPAVSSTEVRRRLAAGEPVDHLLTRGVARLLAASRES